MKKFLKQFLAMICVICMLASNFGGLGFGVFALKKPVVLKQELKASDGRTYEITVTYEIELEEDEEPPEEPDLVVRELVEPTPEPAVQADDVSVSEDAEAPVDSEMSIDDDVSADADAAEGESQSAPYEDAEVLEGILADTVPEDEAETEAVLDCFHPLETEEAPADTNDGESNSQDAALPAEDVPEEGFDYTYKEYVKQAAEAIDCEVWELASVRIFDIWLHDPITGEEIQPESSVKVNIRLLEDNFGEENTVEVVHFAASEENEDVIEPTVMESAVSEDADAVEFETDGFSVYVVVATTTLEQKLTASDGNEYLVTVTYDSDSGIPENAELVVSEIKEGDEGYAEYVAEGAEKLDISAENMAFAKAFDITLRDPQTGEEYQPSKDVQVSIQLLNEHLTDKAEIGVIHFHGEADGESEIIESSVNKGSVEFETDGFSVYVLLPVYLEKVIVAGDGNTYKVTVTYDESAGLPTDAELDVRELSGEEYEEYAAETAGVLDVEELDFTRIFDISIVGADGTHYQPTKDVLVTIEMLGDEMAFNDIRVVHFGDEPEMIEAAVDGMSISFSADSFSIYSITDPVVYRYSYRFFVPVDTNQDVYEEYTLYTDHGDTTFTQILKQGEKLIVPELPTLVQDNNSNTNNNNMTFAGWFEEVTPSGSTTSHTELKQDAFDFDNDVPAVFNENKEVHLYARFAQFAYVIFHEQFTNNVWPVALTRRGELNGGNAQIEIDDVVVTYDDQDPNSNNSAPRKMFRGWSLDPQDSLHDDPSNLETTPITVQANTDLYPVFVDINWLFFVSGATGSGASYVPPRFYYTDTGEDSFTIPTRSGYIFDGWYTEETGGVKVVNSNGTIALTGTSGSFSVSDDKLMISEDATLYGHWTAKNDVKYTVLYWQQNADDDDYSLGGFETRTGTAATMTNVTAQNDKYNFFHLSVDQDKETAGDQTNIVQKVISGSGGTVVNVYYDRNVYMVRLVVGAHRVNTNYYYIKNTNIDLLSWDAADSWEAFLNDSRYYESWTSATNPFTSDEFEVDHYQKQVGGNNYEFYYIKVEARFGASLADKWPTVGLGGTFASNYKFNSWQVQRRSKIYIDNNGSRSVKGLYPIMSETLITLDGTTKLSPQATNTLVACYVTQNYDYTYNYYFWNPDTGDYPATPNISRPASATTAWNEATEVQYDGYNYEGKTHTGSSNTSGDVNFKYMPKQYTLTFMYNGTNLGEDTYYYTQSLAEADKQAYRDAAASAGPPGYSFTGWYADDAGSTRVFFDQASYDAYDNPNKLLYATMPSHAVVLYPGFSAQWFLIKIDPNGGQLSTGQSTFFWEVYGGDPIEEYTTTTRNYIESLTGTHYYALRDRDFYHLTDAWDPIEDSISQRGAYYTDDISDDAADISVSYEYSPNAFRYAGWYEVKDDGTEELYSFGQPIYHDTTLRLHWKQIGTYFIRYDAGEGELDDQDNNEEEFTILDDSEYTDHASIVVTRTANAPDGFNFVGWRVRGAEDTIYSPGSAIEFQSKYTFNESVTVGGVEKEKKVLILDAVYTRIGTASIIYDANGGTMGSNANPGYPVDDDGNAVSQPVPEITKDTANGKLTIGNLVNNTGVKLSSGVGFTMPGATLKGWNTEPDCRGKHYDLGGEGTAGNYYVDTEEPVTLYAEWELTVYFHLNELEENANWGGTWDSDVYTLNSEGDVYSRKVMINNPVSVPELSPVYIGNPNPNNLMFHSWTTTRYSEPQNGVVDEYDFALPVTTELHLYAYYAGPLKVFTHAVDSSAAVLENKDDTWLLQPKYIEVGANPVSLATVSDAANYTNVDLDSYVFAFAAVHSTTAGLNAISEDNAIASLYYNATANRIYVTYRNGSSGPLADEDEVYFVYYLKYVPTISYKKMESDGSLTAVTVSGAAPGQADGNVLYPAINDASYPVGVYDVQGTLTAPITWKTSDDEYTYFAYAIGETAADTDSKLHLLTSASNSESSRPALRVRNTWRGFQYSLDGGTNWVSYGYEPALYVVYFASRPTIITLTEKTFGLPEDMSEQFTYSVSISETTTTTVQNQIRTKVYNSVWRGNSWKWSEVSDTVSDSGSPTITSGTPTVLNPGSQPVTLSNGQSETATVFFTPGNEQLSPETVADISYSWPYSTNPGDGRTKTEVYTFTKTTTATVQTITITQTGKAGYVTDHDGTGTSHTSNLIYTYTTSATSTDQTVVYTNKHTPISVEIHVALVEGSTFLQKDSMRSTTPSDYTLTLHMNAADGDVSKALNGTTFGNILNDTTGDYLFAGVIYGSDAGSDGSTITVLGSDATSVAYGRLYPDDATLENIYERLLNNNTAKALGSNRIYFVYFKQPKIYYMKETLNGALTKLTDEQIKRNGADVVLGDGRTVQQGEKLPVTSEPFLIKQSGGYLVPPDLDGNEYCSLIYRSLAVGPEGKTNTSDMDFNTRSKEIQLRIVNSIVQYSTNGSTWNDFSGKPAVYAIYKEKGFELTVSKTLNDPTTGMQNEVFTVTISSVQIRENSYGYSVFPAGSVAAYTPIVTPGDGTTQGTITFAIKAGQSFVFEGLQRGSYTVKEMLPSATYAAFTVSAKVGVTGQTLYSQAITWTGNTATIGAFVLDNNKTAALTNTFDAICKIYDSALGEEIPFKTLGDAVTYAGTMTGHVATIEMLVDYTMPNTDSVTIPAGYDITLTTASKTVGRYKFGGVGSSAVITRGFNGASMFTVTGASLTTSNIILDGRQAIYKASVNGGIISVSGTDSSVTINEKTVLRKSTTSANGGAIYVGSGAVLRVNGGTGDESNRASILDCVAEKETDLNGNNPAGGGAIFCESKAVKDNKPTIAIDYCTINGHYEMSPATSNASCGGAILMMSGTLSVSNSDLLDCAVTTTIEGQTTDDTYRHGGAIYCKSTDKLNEATVSISNTNIDGHYGDFPQNILNARDGGAVYMKDGVLTISDSTIKNCDIWNKGGGIYASKNATLTNTTVTNCRGRSENVNTAAGGGIYAKGGTLTLNGCTVSNNQSSKGGGVYSTVNVVLINSLIQNNTLTNNTTAYAAGMFLTAKLTIGQNASDNDISSVNGNTTSNGDNSNLLLAESGGLNKSDSVLVKSNLTGLFYVINPKVALVQFGSSATDSLGGLDPDDYNHSVFRGEDGSGLYGKYEKGSTTKIIWWKEGLEPVCKITADNGEVLYLDLRPAIFSSLRDALAVYGGRYDNFKNSTGTVTTPTQIQMLVEQYEMDYRLTSAEIPDKSVTITTAARDDRDEYPYGLDKTLTRPDDLRCIILRTGTTEGPLFRYGTTNNSESITVKNLIIDGGNIGLTNASTGRDGRLFRVEGKGTLIMDDGAELRNSISNEGGAIVGYNSATIVMQGTSQIHDCTALNGKGGAVFIKYNNTSNPTFTMQGSAQIKDCTAVTGGGVAVGSGVSKDNSVFIMTGNASIDGCTATTGAGVYINVGAVMNISGSPTFGGTGIANEATGDLDNTSGNLLVATIDETNGGKTYTHARQDIYIAGYAGAVAPSLVVTGPLSGNDGAIWVWAENSPHYKETEQFAVIATGASPGKLSVFRDARTDADSEATVPLYGVRSETDISHVVWGIVGGERVAFKKVDGFGVGLGGAQFSLYMDADCTAANIVTVTLADNSTNTVITSATTADSSAGIEIGDVSFRAPVGIYYMKEINSPTGCQENTNIYIVLVGSGNVTVPGTRTGEWAATGVLANISQSDINSQRGNLTAGKYEKDSAVFLIDSTTDKAVTTPDIATYGIMNISRPSREVILRKIDDAFNTIKDDGSFVLMRWDHTTVSSGSAGTAGCIFAGDLPLGTYYLHETGYPAGVKHNPNDDPTNDIILGWWYTITVDASGVTCSAASATAPPTP